MADSPLSPPPALGRFLPVEGAPAKLERSGAGGGRNIRDLFLGLMKVPPCKPGNVFEQI